jgi:hypothetical protein
MPPKVQPNDHQMLTSESKEEAAKSMQDEEARELELWNEQNNLFFLNYFFPAAERYTDSTKIINGSLEISY